MHLSLGMSPPVHRFLITWIWITGAGLHLTGARNMTGYSGGSVNLTCPSTCQSAICKVIWHKGIHKETPVASLTYFANKNPTDSNNTNTDRFYLDRTETLTIRNLSLDDAGYYTCVRNNAYDLVVQLDVVEPSEIITAPTTTSTHLIELSTDIDGSGPTVTAPTHFPPSREDPGGNRNEGPRPAPIPKTVLGLCVALVTLVILLLLIILMWSQRRTGKLVICSGNCICDTGTKSNIESVAIRLYNADDPPGNIYTEPIQRGRSSAHHSNFTTESPNAEAPNRPYEEPSITGEVEAVSSAAALKPPGAQQASSRKENYSPYVDVEGSYQIPAKARPLAQPNTDSGAADQSRRPEEERAGNIYENLADSETPAQHRHQPPEMNRKPSFGRTVHRWSDSDLYQAVDNSPTPDISDTSQKTPAGRTADKRSDSDTYEFVGNPPAAEVSANGVATKVKSSKGSDRIGPTQEPDIRTSQKPSPVEKGIIGQGQAPSARDPLQRSDSPVVYAAPIKPKKRPFKRAEHIYSDITAPDLPSRGYRQDQDPDKSGCQEESPYSLVHVARSKV